MICAIPGRNVDTLVSPALSAKMFDMGVNCGPEVPVTFLQRALNAFNRQGADYPDVPVDGKAGPVTSSALRNFIRVRGARGLAVTREPRKARGRVFHVGRCKTE